MDPEMMMGMAGMGGGGADIPIPDTSETVYISSLALLKMLKHGRAGVPLEVMGLMLGTLVDEYTVRVVDVFAMPQTGSAVSVEAVDVVFQQQMIDMLELTGRSEKVVGWYHSHPGFGCWLSGTDQNTAESFERLQTRSVSVVVDPIQSVKGKVVIDAFRLIDKRTAMMGQEPRQTTSVVGHLAVPSIAARVHGLGKYYYSMPISYRKNALEEKMLQNLGRKRWNAGLAVPAHTKVHAASAASLDVMAKLSADYAARVVDEETRDVAELSIAYVGKVDPKKRLEAEVAKLLANNIVQVVGTMIDTVVF